MKSLQRYGATVLRASTMKSSRALLDLFEDRIRQAAVEPTLLAFGQRLAELMASSPSEMWQPAVTDFIALASSSPQQASLLAWVRANHTLYAVLCSAKFEDADRALENLSVPDISVVTEDQALPRRAYHIGIRATSLTPVSHGADGKSGNATLFRRMAVLGRNGGLLELPYYAGNAIRGQLRDILADHFAGRLGLTPSRTHPPFRLWFFHAIYAGGALEEVSEATKAITRELGDNGAVRADGVHEFRDRLPAMSLLGAALGNKVLSGLIDVGDWRPVCHEWGNGGTSRAAELFEWLYLTRRDDHEDRGEHHAGMIASTECIKAGTAWEGGIDVRAHATELARSALGVGLQLLAERGRIGAQNRADLGSVRIELEGAPSGEAYEAYLAEHKADILAYLEKIRALGYEAQKDAEPKPARKVKITAADSTLPPVSSDKADELFE